MVNGQAIPEVAVARALLGVESKNRDKARPEFLKHIVDNVLVDQYLAYQKVTADPKDIETQLADFKNEVKKAGQEYAKVLENLMLTEAELKDEIAAQVRWEKFVAAQAPDAKLRAFFDGNVEMFDGTLVRARHILITPKAAQGAEPDAKAKQDAAQQLRDLKAKIEADVGAALAKLPADLDPLAREQARSKLTEDAFIKVAKEKSDCPSARDGGDLNWFPRAGTMVEPFAKAAFALKPFQVSDLVETEFGYHLVLVTARKAGQPTKFEDVKETVKEVYGGKLREAVTNMMRPRAQIQVSAQK